MGKKINMRLLHKYSTKTTRGVLSKAWYVDEKNVRYLVKGNTENTLEPYSEVIASRIAHILDIPCVEYRLVNADKFKDVKGYGGKHFSICKDFMQNIKGQNLSFSLYLNSTSEKKIDDYWWYTIMYRDKFDINFIFKMLIFDAFIGNKDRHLNNWDVVIDEYGKILFAPLFDHGLSLLSYCSLSRLEKSWKIGPDKSKPFRNLHRSQVHLISRYIRGVNLFNYVPKEFLISSIINSCRDVFNILGNERTEYIIRYLSNRYDMYLKKFMR